MEPSDIRVFYLTASAQPVAERIAAHLGAKLDAPSDMDGVGAYLRAQFAAGHGLIGVCAAGILIRSLAPMIGSKWQDPPVLAVAEDASSVVPLLGGHHGANGLARDIAALLDAHPALTTAGDLRLGVALDAPPKGWRLDNPLDAKAATASLLAGTEASLSGFAPWLEPVAASDADAKDMSPVVLSVAGCAPLVYRRPHLTLGVGCARHCPPDELVALVGTSLSDAGLNAGDLTGIWSVALKSDEAAVHHLGDVLGLPVRFYPVDVLEAQTPRLANPSDVVFAEVGCHGVSEAAALAAGGDGATLVMEKHKSANATCAVASDKGQGIQATPRGRLSVIGIGPGAADWRTPEASRLVAEASVLVGYGLYIDLLGALAADKPRHDFPLGGEEARCRHALELAGEGRNVALICSGDAGIYAMGALVMELMARAADAGGVSDTAKRVEVINAPGVSALQAASARAGAILGHDFCTISLSDLLTPRETIIQRLHAAAEGDFVIAFYNPVSKRRRTLLAEARDILLSHRPTETPVLLASNLGRPEEKLRLRTLATLEVDEVDMLTVVLVGSSQSKVFRTGDSRTGADGWQIYTPRGYAKKIDAKEPS